MDEISDGSVLTHPTSRCNIRFENGNRVLVLKGSIVTSVELAMPATFGNISWMLGMDDEEEMVVHTQLLSSWIALLTRRGPLIARAEVIGLYMCLLMQPNLAPYTQEDRLDEQDVLHQFLNFLRYHYHRVCFVQTRVTLLPEQITVLQKTRDMLLQIPCLLGSEEHCSEFNPDDLLSEDERSAVIRCQQALLFRGRAVGTTSCGKFFSALNRVQKGDVIVALEGSTDRLWTLRRDSSGHCYCIVGDVNVPGYMHGEIYKDTRPEDVDVNFGII